MSWPLSELTQHPIVQSIYTRMIINKAKLYSTIAKQTRRTEPRSYSTIAKQTRRTEPRSCNTNSIDHTLHSGGGGG
jgi:hypothetical protein